MIHSNNNEPSKALMQSSQQHLAASLILDKNEIDLSELSLWARKLNQPHVDFADIYLQYAEKEAWMLDEGVIKNGQFSITQGVGVRAIHQDKTAFIYSDYIQGPQIQSLVDRSTKMLQQQTGSLSQMHVKNHLANPSHHLNLANRDLYDQGLFIDQINTQYKIDLLQTIDQLARQNPWVFNVSASLVAVHDHIMVARSDDRIHSDSRPMVRLSMQVFLKKGDVVEIGQAGGGGRYHFNYFTADRLANYVKQAIASAMHNFEAKAAPAGLMDVVLGNGWPGILLHEAVGHGLEADFNRKGTSLFSEKLGKQVAAKGVTIVDDGTIANQRGSLHIDDEGNPSQYNVLIEDGILVNYLQDELNARLMNRPVTGNGRRENYASVTMPRMTNTYMLNAPENQAHDLQEMIESIEYGIYAQEFGGGQVDITSGQFVFSASQAFLIEKGQITAPLKGATLIGSGADSLMKITMIGRDSKLDEGVGTCGKDGQSVPVGVGQPSLKIAGMTVGGAEI
jgi:TldD protein